jgi:hypothetical protein
MKLSGFTTYTTGYSNRIEDLVVESVLLILDKHLPKDIKQKWEYEKRTIRFGNKKSR